MSKFFKKALSFVVALATAVCVCASCGGNNGGNSGNSGGGKESQTIDEGKTTVRVFNYKAGYGDAWLDEIKNAFEAKYANTSFEEGKKGVQIIPDSRMGDMSAAQASASVYDVLFLENEDLVAYRNGGAVEDLTDIVTATGIDGKTIESKLNDVQKEFFGNKEGKYDALPRHYGTTGIIYNIDLFEEKSLYIGKNGGYVGKEGKSAGLDGIEGTDDDGLPTTYAEFFDLLDEMVVRNVVPLCWNGKYYRHYLGFFFDSLVADYEGVDQMMLNYNYSGTAKDLIKIGADGKAVINGGVPETESVAITTANGCELARQAGKYYAMDFMHKIISDSDYYYKDSFDGSFTHTLSEQKYLQNGYTNQEKKIAMLLEGPWWQNEASAIFRNMAASNPAYSMNSRRFGVMPLPKATSEKATEGKNVYSDDLNTFVCLKKDSKRSAGITDAAKKFIQYCTSDEALVMFTKSTGAPLAYSGYMTETDKATLSTFSKSLIDHVEKSDMYYRVSLNSFYNTNIDRLSSGNIYETIIDGEAYVTPAYGIYETSDEVSAIGYFENYYKTFKTYEFWK